VNGNPGASSGTSFSTPQIAGWAACLWQSKHSASPYLIRTVINQSADHYNTPDNHRGYGIPNFHIASNLLGVSDTALKTTSEWLKLSSRNPFTDKLVITIDLTETQNVSFSLSDISGKSVWSNTQTVNAGLHNMSINTPSLPTGIYVLKAVTDKLHATLKVVKD
jgi:subtilisin family serine protease